jgi:hypothetical protein
LKSNQIIEVTDCPGKVNVSMGVNETVRLDAPQRFTGTISGFKVGDTIDLKGVSASDATLQGNILSVGGVSLHLGAGGIDYSKYSFETASDGNGGTNVTLGNGLDNLSVNMNGGIQGFHKTYTATKGATYEVDFDPFSIPDSIKVSDNKHTYINSGMITDDNGSGPLHMTFTVDPKASGDVKIDVIGSAPGTAWDLSISRVNQPTLAPTSAPVATMSPTEAQSIMALTQAIASISPSTGAAQTPIATALASQPPELLAVNAHHAG